MKLQIVSQSEAARKLSISRKTIQRAVADGRLKRHGTKDAGSRAAQVDLDEAREKCVESKSRRGVQRSKMVPVWKQVQRFLEKEKFDAKQVISVYFKACLGGADIDFLLYCIERLRDEDAIFVSIVINEPVSPLWTEPLTPYAAKRLRSFADSYDGSALQDVKLYELWHGLVYGCVQALIDVEPAIVYDRSEDGACLVCVPRWLSDAPPGLLPVVGGKLSVVQPRNIENKAVVNRAAMKLSKCVEKARKSGEDLSGLAVHSLSNGVMVYTLEGHDVVADGSAVMEQQQIEALCTRLAISVTEIKCLVKAWRVLRGDILGGQTQKLDEDRLSDGANEDKREASEQSDGCRKASDDLPPARSKHRAEDTSVDRRDEAIHGLRKTPSVLKSVLGVSRTTASQWMMKNGLRAKQSQKIHISRLEEFRSRTHNA